jgi:hypothetical protein
MGSIQSRLFAFIAFYACTLPLEASTPESTLQQFFGALSRGEKSKAWEMLSSDTQVFLVHKTTLASENSLGLIPNSPANIVFMTESAPPVLEKVELIEANETTARLRVVASQKGTLLTMKKEAGQWKLVLHHGVSDE